MTAPTDPAGNYASAEGLEDALSLWKLDRPLTVLGLPGIAALAHIELKKGDRLVHVKDGDEPDSPAAQACIAGCDAQILNGVRVKITPTARSEDANAVRLLWGEDILNLLVSQAREAQLSFTGRIKKLAQLEGLAFAQEREVIRKIFKAPAALIDAEVKKLRPKPTATPTEDTNGATPPGALSLPPDPPWIGPPPVLRDILQAIYTILMRFVVMSEAQAIAVTLWIAASHLVHSTKIRLELFPHLSIQSKDAGSGKSTLLTLIWNGLPRAKLWTYPSGAFVVRAIEQGSPSVCLDELQYAEDRNLLRVIDASHLRRLAYVPVLVPDKNGAYVPREYCVWTPMALARLGEFSAAQQSRSIVIWLLPKLVSEMRERLRHAEVAEMADCRRQLVAWADTVTTWAPPPIPQKLANREGDNWEPLLGVAALAGPDWLERAQKAAEELMQTERLPSVVVRLLRSLWLIYQPDPTQDPIKFLATADVIAGLIADPDDDWATMGSAGRSITPAWLRERLSHLLDPPGSTRENAFGPRGYAFRQLKGSLDRYVGTHPALDADIIPSPIGSPLHPVHPAQTATASKQASNPAISAEPDEAPEGMGSAGHPAHDAASKAVKNETSAPAEPDEPDLPGEPIQRRDIEADGTSRAVAAANGEDPAAAIPEPEAPGTPPAPERRSSIAAAILEVHDAHPEWSAARIGKAVGRTKSAVQRILDAAAPPKGAA